VTIMNRQLQSTMGDLPASKLYIGLTIHCCKQISMLQNVTQEYGGNCLCWSDALKMETACLSETMYPPTSSHALTA
jgi:hypothetical protein